MTEVTVMLVVFSIEPSTRIKSDRLTSSATRQGPPFIVDGRKNIRLCHGEC